MTRSNGARVALAAALVVAAAGCGGGGSGGDKELKVGWPATVSYTDDTTKVKSTVELTPKSIEKKSIADVSAIELEPSQKSSTPYPSRCTSITSAPGRSRRTATRSTASIFFVNGDFDRCNPEDEPASLKKGESFATCLTFLVPKGGGSLAKVTWLFPDVTWRP